MVGFWPWRGDDSSPASFEKTLSTLSTKIAETQSRLDRTRTNSRRTQVLWTLYLSFAYLVYTIVLIFVVGHKNFGSYEWTGLAGGPILIYTTRTALIAVYTFRIETLVSRLKEHQEERAKTIQKLKDATKYDSTMELIEKYGGQENKSKGKKRDPTSGDGEGEADRPKHKAKKSSVSQGAPGRTRMPPPPTANIQRRDGLPNSMEPSAEFAPNAGFAPSQFPSQTLPPPPAGYPQYTPAPAEPHWYDRIFDVLLGEDETAPKNRIVLICQACRLVNGQAPPGTKSLSDLGSWKCMSCGALNGELDEGKRIMNEVLAQAADDSSEGKEESDKDEEDEEEASSDGVVDVAKEHIVEELVKEEDDGPAAGVRKRRGKGKK